MFKLFNKIEYKRFDLQPRYWDPEKEKREERDMRVRKELGLKEDGDEYIPNIEGRLRNEYKRRQAERAGGSMRYTVRLFMILIMIFLAFFYLVMHNMDSLLEWLE